MLAFPSKMTKSHGMIALARQAGKRLPDERPDLVVPKVNHRRPPPIRDIARAFA